MFRSVSVLILLLITGPTAASDFSFENIMKFGENKKITYEREGYYTRPFKIFRDGSDWILEQQENYESSSIKDKGNNKFLTIGFPSNWTVNGTWMFSKNGDKCRIDHEDGGMNMKWAC